MRVLVTGGAGFIGSHLVKKLKELGDEITVVDNFSTGNMSTNLENVYICEEDLKEFLDRTTLEDFDEVYHLAALVGVRRVLENPIETIETNLGLTEKLLEVAKLSKNSPKIFIASTSEVYGKNDKWRLNENDDRITGSTSKKRWIYAETKAMDEFLANLYAEEYNLPIVTGRFFSVVGPMQSSRYGMVLPNFVEQALANKDITVYGDGTQIRSFLHVEDCVRMVLKLMRSQRTVGDVFNIGNPEPIMIKDLAWRVKHWCKSKSNITYTSYEEAYGKGFEDMRRRVPDITKLNRMFGKSNTKNIDEIIKDTIEYYRSKDEVVFSDSKE